MQVNINAYIWVVTRRVILIMCALLPASVYAQCYIQYHPDGSSTVSRLAPVDLTYPRPREKTPPVLKEGERQEGTPITQAELEARLASHVVIVPNECEQRNETPQQVGEHGQKNEAAETDKFASTNAIEPVRQAQSVQGSLRDDPTIQRQLAHIEASAPAETPSVVPNNEPGGPVNKIAPRSHEPPQNNFVENGGDNGGPVAALLAIGLAALIGTAVAWPFFRIKPITANQNGLRFVGYWIQCSFIFKFSHFLVFYDNESLGMLVLFLMVITPLAYIVGYLYFKYKNKNNYVRSPNYGGANIGNR